MALESRVKELETEVGDHRGKAQKYSKEAGDRRVENERLSKENEELRKQLEGGKSTPGAPTPPDGETAKLRTEVAELRAKDKEREDREKKRDVEEKSLRHRSRIQELVAAAKLESPEDAVELLMGRTELATDGKTLTFGARDKDTGETTARALTGENFEAAGLLAPIFWPAKGVPGGGGKGPKEVGGEGSVDASKAGDRSFWKKNKEQIVKQQKTGAAAQ